MTNAGVQPVRWSNRKWAYAVALSIAVQLALVVYLGERGKERPPRVRFETSIQLAADPWTDTQFGQAPALKDPTLFALPGLNGFSGRAWLRFPPPQHRLTNWTEPPQWLAPDVASLAAPMTEFVRTNKFPPLLVADKPLPPRIASGLSAPVVPVRGQSDYRVEGELALRTLEIPLNLPPWPHSDILSNSVVQMLVDADGRTLSATLLPPGSGSPAADQAAVQLATRLRFDPSPRHSDPTLGSMTSGRIIFLWHTIPAVATNHASPGP
jgi:TonB family protein